MELVMDRTENVDLRRRGFFYEKLLSTDDQLAMKVLNGEKPTI